MNKHIAFVRFFVCCLLLCFLLCIPAYGAENRLPSGIGYEEIDAAIRDYIKEHEASTAGLAWSVFDEKEELSAGFYGYEDRENQLPVDEETVFEWGSGTKILVWVSVMQLYDEGQLDLEADIRTYLPEGFLSNLRYDTPVTMLHLMNHTAGFQYGLADVNIKQAGLYANLEEAVSAHKPEQIYEPGTITAYSNWGTSLAAYIVERISGMEFADYVHEHIFAPLGMERSALYMDLSDNGWVQEKRKELQCYTSEGELMQDSFDYITLYPSGRCVSTFGDFKALARAVLTKDPRIMSAEAWDTMFSPSDYFAGTELPKNYHGLWAVYLGVPAIGHIGRTGGSSCYLLVDPEHGVGSLFACNQGGDLVYTEGVRSLIYGDFQYEDFVEEPAIPAKTYRNASIDANGAFKLMAYISATGAPLNTAGQYYQVSPFASRSRVEFAYMDYQEIPDSRVLAESFTILSYIAGLVLLALSVPVRLVLGLIGMRKRKEGGRELVLWSIIATLLPFLVTAFYLYAGASVAFPSTRYVWAFCAIGVIAVCMAAMAVYGMIRTVRGRFSWKKKAFYYMIAAILILSVVYVCYWNMFMFWKI